MLSGTRRRAGAAGVVLTLALAGLVLSQTAAPAAPCDPPVASPIACENSKAGSPKSEWDVSGSGSSTIQGFATDISVNKGETVRFKIKTPASAYRLDIYRMGYYSGSGARKVATANPSASLPQTQPACLTNSSTGLIDCGNWAESASWAVPSDAVSGIYFAKLVRTDGTSGSSHVVFVVRDDASHSSLLFQTSDTTWQAYNEYGGNSLYTGSPDGRAYKVSYNRPFTTRGTGSEDFVFNSEYPMVRWLESNGYDVTYFTGVDSDRRGSLIRQHGMFMSVGHDEYWSGGQRANVEAARAAGVHLAFFSGNEIFWKTRWEQSIDASQTAYRTLVTYKETHANSVIDPADPPTWTGSWRDPRFSPPADGGRPENGLSGTIFTVNCCTYAMKVPAADGKMRLWRNTTIATQAPGGTVTLPNGTLGYEWDEDLDNGARPAGLIRMSSTTVSGVDYLQDYGSNYSSGTATHHLTLYRASSGALVFGAGTVQWPWGLDSNHDGGSAAADSRMQQATVNLLADMGAQPATLRPGLVAASRTTDATAPASTITSPAAGSNLPTNQPVTVTGTAADSGGGVVGGVEVSVDGGSSWHPANGRESWSYTWTPRSTGSVTIKSRAADDSANLETPDAGVTLTVVDLVQRCDAHQPRGLGFGGGRARGEVPGRLERLRQRSALLQGRRQHGHPRRAPVERQRHPARQRDLHRGDRVRLAAGQLREPRGRHRQHHLCGVVLRAKRPLRRRRRLLRQLGGGQPAAARAGRWRRRARRRVPLRQQRRLPHRHLRVRQLLGGRGLHHFDGGRHHPADGERPLARGERDRGGDQRERDGDVQ